MRGPTCPVRVGRMRPLHHRPGPRRMRRAIERIELTRQAVRTGPSNSEKRCEIGELDSNRTVCCQSVKGASKRCSPAGLRREPPDAHAPGIVASPSPPDPAGGPASNGSAAAHCAAHVSESPSYRLGRSNRDSAPDPSTPRSRTRRPIPRGAWNVCRRLRCGLWSRR